MFPLLRKALEEAKLRRLIADNPTDHIPRPQKEPTVSDCYSPEECRKLLGVLRDDPMELPITIAVLYGLRRSEVLGLRWGAVDFERGSITICHSVTVASIDGHRQRITRDKVKRAAHHPGQSKAEIQFPHPAADAAGGSPASRNCHPALRHAGTASGELCLSM